MTDHISIPADVVHDPNRRGETCVTYHGGATEHSPSQSVIEAVAETTGSDPDTLGPLYSAVDPDALDGVFRDETHECSVTDGYVRFRFEGCTVIVRADGATIASLADTDQP